MSTLMVAGVVLCVATGVLAWHIYEVTHRPKPEMAFWQMACLQINQPNDTALVQQIQQALSQQDGFMHSYANVSDGLISFAIDVRKSSPVAMYNTLPAPIKAKVSLQTITNAELANACPVIEKESGLMKLATWISKL